MRSREIVLALALLVSLAGCRGAEQGAGGEADVAAGPPGAAADAPTPAEEAARVQLDRVAEAALRDTLEASGTIDARRITELAAEVPGRIVEVRVDLGDPVETGDLLFRIDPGPYDMAVAEANAALHLALAESSNASEEAERLGRLVAQSAASQQRYDQLRTAAEVAEARVAQARARLARARRDREHTEVRAPYAGTIVERRAHEGAMAGAQPVVVLQETGALEAILGVPEATPVPVRKGDPVRVFIEGVADPVETAVERVSRRVEPETRTYEVRAPVNDPSGSVKAGSYARAQLDVGRTEPRPVVARDALVTRDGRTYALRVEGEVARLVAVRTGIADATRVEVLSGLAPGDLVVRGEAARRITEGTRLRVDRAGEVLTAQIQDTP